jgi:hypothetical protein
MQFRSTAYHYMLRPEMVPVVPYPWLPDYEEYDENFDFSLFESSTVPEESATKWWLDTRIPGYSLTWKSLSRHLWWKLYHLKPELFFTPWILLARVRFWENRFRVLMVQLFKEYVVNSFLILLLFLDCFYLRFPNTHSHPDPVKLYLVKKLEYIEQMNRLYKTSFLLTVVLDEVEIPDASPTSLDNALHPSSSVPIPSLLQASPFSFSPRLHRILGRSRYVPNEEEDPVDEGQGNDRSDLRKTPIGNVPADNSGTASNGVQEGSDHEETHDYHDENQAPSPLEYSDGENDKATEMVVSDKDDEEEVDELNSSEYEGFSMTGMLVNTDSGGYYEEVADTMDVTEDTAQMDLDDRLSEKGMDEELPERKTENKGVS